MDKPVQHQVSRNSAVGDAVQINAPVGRDVINQRFGIIMSTGVNHPAETDQERCRRALDKTDPLSGHSYGDIITDRGIKVNGTCQWIEEDKAFKAWRDQSNKLLWICGGSGKGKTFLSIHLADLLETKPPHQPSSESHTPLVLTFFCNYANIERSGSVFVVRSLLAQLLKHDTSFYELLLPAFQNCEAQKDDLFSDNNQEKMWELVLEILGCIKRQVYLVLDGLDECDDASIIFLGRKLQHLYSKRPKCEYCKFGTVLVSRPLHQSVNSDWKIDLDQHNEKRDELREKELKIFAKKSLEDHLSESTLDREYLLHSLISQAQGRYLWLSLVIPMIQADPSLEDEILHDPKFIETWLPQGLDSIYDRILDRISQENRTEVRNILLCVCSAYRPLSASEIATFLGKADGKLDNRLKQCANFLTSDRRTGVYKLVHLSLKEYLLDLGQSSLSRSLEWQTRFLGTIDVVLKGAGHFRRSSWASHLIVNLVTMYCVLQWIGSNWPGNKIFTMFILLVIPTAAYTTILAPLVNLFSQCMRVCDRKLLPYLRRKKAFLRSLFFGIAKGQDHEFMLEQMLRLMQAHFIDDRCGILPPLRLQESTAKEELHKNLVLSHIEYSCRHWIRHLCNSGLVLRENDKIHKFLRAHLLHWLEALGWMRRVSEGINAIISLESLDSSYNSPLLSAFLRDAKRFIYYTKPAIEQTPFQIYRSALVFAPSTSVVRQQFKDCMPQWIKSLPVVEKYWSSLLQTLEGHSDTVGCVVFSPDGKTLASASYDKTIKLWEVGSGTMLQTLESHSGWVGSVVFSPDGKTLASASRDKTIKLWDVGSGAMLQTLEGHSDWIMSVTFSPDGKTLASASRDTTIKLWDVRSGPMLQTLESHSGWVGSVVFSPDGKTLAFASRDKTIKLWDVRSGPMLQTLERHSDWVESVVFSPDGKTLASASRDTTIKLWDVRSGTMLQTLEDYLGWVGSVVFSPDGKTLAFASRDKTIKLWDVRSGTMLQTLEGHSDWIMSVDFSLDGKTLASASRDKTIKLWDVGSGAMLQTLESHSGWVGSVVFSPDGKTLAFASRDKTIKLWDVGSGAMLQTLEGHSDWIMSVTFSPDGKTLASASRDTTIKLWDVRSGPMLQTLERHSDWVESVVFSPDGKTLASASRDTTIKLWDVGSGTMLQTLEAHSDTVGCVVFSPDGKTLASASRDKTIKLWDVGSGAMLQTLEDYLGWVCSVVFSPDGKTLASASHDTTIKLWDVGSGKMLQTLEDHLGWVISVVFSPDGKTLASASHDTTIKLWDVRSGKMLQTLENHSGWIMSIDFSPDGEILASASRDKTIKLWDVGSGAMLQTLEGHSDWIMSVTFSPDGKTLASASRDTTIKLWDVGLGTMLQTLEGHSDWVISVAFSPDGETVASIPHSDTTRDIPRLLSIWERWLMLGEERILWLPPDYRPSSAVVHKSLIAIGCPSGRVIILELALSRLF